MKYKLTIELLEEIVKSKINPELAQHYGCAKVTGYNDGIVFIKFKGACSTCPSAKDTLNNVVKSLIMKEVKEVKDVILDTSISEDLLDFAKKILNKNIS